jgi:hypothetical protein
MCAVGEKRDVMMFDVDSKDTSVGLSCPPPAFVTEEFLVKTAATLNDDGTLAHSFLCQNS